MQSLASFGHLIFILLIKYRCQNQVFSFLLTWTINSTVTIWSTPYGAFSVSYGVLQDQLHMTIYIAILSTPYGHFLMPYGVLHVVTISCHMEYSIWSLWSSYSHVDVPYVICDECSFFLIMLLVRWPRFEEIPFLLLILPKKRVRNLLKNHVFWLFFNPKHRNTFCHYYLAQCSVVTQYC